MLRRLRGIVLLLKSAFKEQRFVDDLAIYGSREFCDHVAAALELLRERAPAAFAQVKRYIDAVVMSRHSGVDAKKRPAMKWSVEYLASGLAHESHHCHLHWSYRASHPGEKVPEAIYSREEAERSCLEYQIAVFLELGGSEERAARIRESMATEWWLVPWEERTW